MINFLNGNIISETGLRLPFSFQLHAAARRPRQRDDPVGRSRLPGDEEPDQHFSREPRRRGPPSLHHLLARQGNLNKYRNKKLPYRDGGGGVGGGGVGGGGVGGGGVGGQVVSVLAFYSDDPSSNPAEAYSFFCKICV